MSKDALDPKLAAVATTTTAAAAAPMAKEEAAYRKLKQRARKLETAIEDVIGHLRCMAAITADAKHAIVDHETLFEDKLHLVATEVPGLAYELHCCKETWARLQSTCGELASHVEALSEQWGDFAVLRVRQLEDAQNQERESLAAWRALKNAKYLGKEAQPPPPQQQQLADTDADTRRQKRQRESDAHQLQNAKAKQATLDFYSESDLNNEVVQK